MKLFLSTPSARRATCSSNKRASVHHISIHALREEGDLKIMAITHDPEIFLSTPSARRATGGWAGMKERQVISIHALREEGDEL